MGTVYLAEQLAPVFRQVALKFIKLGMDSKQVIARFEVERQALALIIDMVTGQPSGTFPITTGRGSVIAEEGPDCALAREC